MGVETLVGVTPRASAISLRALVEHTILAMGDGILPAGCGTVVDVTPAPDPLALDAGRADEHPASTKPAITIAMTTDGLLARTAPA